MRRSGAIKHYATLIRRSYAAEAKVSLLIDLVRIAIPAGLVVSPMSSISPHPSVIHPVDLQEAAQANAGTKSTASEVQKTPGNHAYTPMTPDSAAQAKSTSKNASGAPKQYSTNAGSCRHMSTSKSPGNHGYPPTAGASSSGKKSQGQGSTGTTAGSTGKDTPVSNPGNHAYPPTAGTGSASSQKISPQTGV